jgi:hypothetical protein
MHVDYEVSEKDFFEAQKLAIKKSPFRLARWFPLVGLVLLVGCVVELPLFKKALDLLGRSFK